LLRQFETLKWNAVLGEYTNKQGAILHEIERRRTLARVPVRLPSGAVVTLSPGGQNPLIRSIVEEFCPRFIHDGIVVYIGDAEDKFLHLDADYLEGLGVMIPSPAKMPDLIVHDPRRNWLLLIEAVASAGPVDGKRRRELKHLFKGCAAGLVFVTAFLSRDAMRSFLNQISWESEVWVADDPDHLIHFNGERFLGPYPDALPSNT
jgi:BsuBI/PstI restriction endonuclease domain